jgi:HSP20 family protein
MTLVRWSPVRDMMSIQNEMNRLMGDLMGGRSEAPGETGLWPAADVAEHAKEYSVKVELPGMEMKDIKVHLTEDVLVIRGEKKREQTEQGKSWKCCEREYGLFERSFRFPIPVQGEKVKAKYVNGVLTVTVPKAEEVTPREIQIEG